jgi:hypothetical protein
VMVEATACNWADENTLHLLRFPTINATETASEPTQPANLNRYLEFTQIKRLAIW